MNNQHVQPTPATDTNPALLWLATFIALIIAIGVPFYLRHALRTGVITTFSRLPKEGSRKNNPIQFWWSFAVYSLAAALAGVGLIYRVTRLLVAHSPLLPPHS